MAPKDSIRGGDEKKYEELVVELVEEEEDSDEWESDETSDEEDFEEGENMDDPISELKEENRRLTLQLIEDQRLLEEANQQLEYIRRLVEEKTVERDNLMALRANQEGGENGHDRQQA